MMAFNETITFSAAPRAGAILRDDDRSVPPKHVSNKKSHLVFHVGNLHPKRPVVP